MNGISLIKRERLLPRLTAAVWYAISSTVTGMVLSHPWITLPNESPTNETSMLELSIKREKV